MRFVCLLIVGVCLCSGRIYCADDARSLVARAVAADDHSDRLARDYVFKLRNDILDLDNSGDVKATRSTVDEVLYIGGKRFLRPLEKDGKPIPAADQRKEQLKIDRAAAQASRMSEAEHQRSIQAAEQERARRRAEYRDIPDAFNFKLLGEAMLGDRAAYQIQATPRPAYIGKLHNVLNNVEGTIWIDKLDFNWVKFEGEVLNPFYLGFFLARIGKGTHISYEMMHLDAAGGSGANAGLWVPRQLTLKASARFALLKKLNVQQKVTFSDYRKFQTDSRIISTAEIP
jgi:hypothetical protein